MLFPKLFRRLSGYFGEGLGGMENFPAWLTATLEQVNDLTTTNFTHFDNLVDLQDNTVRLTVLPEEVVFISAKLAITIGSDSQAGQQFIATTV